MPRRILGALVCLAAGCASLGLDADAAARARVAQARAAVDGRDFDAAWADLRELRVRYPESPVTAEAFPLAAAVFQHGYRERRFLQADSPWMRTEPAFIFDWLAADCGGAEFPTEQARALFVGMPYGVFRDFLAFAKTRPELARWRITAEDDDGIIETVEAVPAAP